MPRMPRVMVRPRGLIWRLGAFISALFGQVLAVPPRIRPPVRRHAAVQVAQRPRQGRTPRAFVYCVSAATRTEYPKRGTKVCLLLLRHHNGEFGPAGGLANPGEKMWVAAKRESVEETGYRWNKYNGRYQELSKFYYGSARLYVHAVPTLPPCGLPGPFRKGREIIDLHHFSMPKLRSLLKGDIPNASVRQGGEEALMQVIVELEKQGFT